MTDATGPGRRTYLDVLRGIAVLIMIEAHVIDSWTRVGDRRAAVWAVQRRGLEIFLLAFVFRFQSFVLSHSPAWALLKVDILNIMGPSIILSAALWGVFRSARARIIAFAVATVAIVWATPSIRHAAALAALSD